VTLAVFHTVFNVIGVLLMWPLAGSFSRWANRRFMRREAVVAQPKYLDESTLSIPEVGVRAVVRETERASGMLVLAISDLLHAAPTLDVKKRLVDVESLFDRIDEFLAKLSGARMTTDTSAIVATLLGVLVRFRSTLHMSYDWMAASETTDERRLIPPDSYATLDALLECSNPASPRFDPEASRTRAKEFKVQRRAQREAVLEQAAQGSMSVRDATRTLPLLVELGELTSELSKATVGLANARSWDHAAPEPLAASTED
jgi:phosphate:Na+ symporter